MKEWVVQTHSRLSQNEQTGYLRAHRDAAWRTWVDAKQTDQVMEPMTLEEASDRMVTHLLLAKNDSPHTWAMIQKTIPGRLRLFNIRTKEEIPIEVFGLL